MILRKARLLLSLVALIVLTGCVAAQVKPGSIKTALATQTQSQSPKEKTELATDSLKTVEFIAPAGTVIAQKDPSGQNYVTFTVPTNVPVRIVQHDKVDSSIGAADMSIGKLIAKLNSVKWIQGVGIIVFLFGVASFAYPPLRLIIGSVTTSIVIAAAGVALIVLPTVIVGNEILILVGCGGAALLYLFIHRYGKKSGEVDVYKKWIDKNGDGKVDPGEIVK